MSDEERKHKAPLCCDANEVATIITCLSELKNTVECVLDCTDDHSSGMKERIVLCKLLDEIRQIEAKLDSPLFGLNEIKNEIIEINDVITNSTFGLREIKNEIIDINNVLTNEFFGLNEIKNEIIQINDLLNNATFGIPELKNEIKVIENRTGRTIRLLTNEEFGLNEIKNEIRGIETDVRALNRPLTCATDSIRICGCDVDGVVRPARTDVTGILGSLPSASVQSQKGHLFSITQIVDPFSLLNIIFINPSGNSSVMYLDKIIAGLTMIPTDIATAPLTYEGYLTTLMYRNVTITGDGVPITPRNLNTGSGNLSNMGIYAGVTVEPPTAEQQIIAASQLNQQAILDLNGRIVVPPNTNLLISFGRRSTPSRMAVTVTITWYEQL